MAAFGPAWVVRIGVAIAVVAAVLACAFAWRELFSARRPTTGPCWPLTKLTDAR